MNRVRAGILLSILLFCGAAIAQTDYSLRIRSLSIHLSGILDDALTDVFLNPARARVFEQVELYAARQPRGTVTTDFPTQYRYRTYPGPGEDYRLSYEYNPIALSAFLPLGRDVTLSVGTQVDLLGSDEVTRNSGYEILTVNGTQAIEQRTRSNENAGDMKHLIFDLAGAKGGRTSFGVRLRASHDAYEGNALNTYGRFGTDFDTRTEVYARDEFNLYLRKLEESDFAAAVGLFRPGKRITDVVVGGGVNRQLLSATILDYYLDDDDADGNGYDIGGGSARQHYDRYVYQSHRDYLAFHIFARTHVDIWRSLRATQYVSWKHSDGDGGADYIDETYVSGFVYGDSRQRIRYSYDGTVENTHLSTCIGYADELREGFILAFGLNGTFSRVHFEEGGRGEGSFYERNSGTPNDTISLASPYMQRHERIEKHYGLVLPVACEWQFHRNLKLRIGLEYTATRDDDRADCRMELGELALPGEFQDTDSDMDYDLAHDTEVRLNNGIEVNIKDRFVIDLLASSSSVVDFASYVYLSARYRF